MTSNGQPQRLRRTIAPYVGQIIILSLATLYFVFLSIKAQEWKSTLVAVPVMWLLFSPLVYFGLRYKISWTDEEICMAASGGKVRIKYEEITDIESETSKPGELLAASRPFRRIAIYAGKPHGEAKHIDVSLKHFVATDIRKLMHAIHDRRPDLTLPKKWT